MAPVGPTGASIVLVEDDYGLCDTLEDILIEEGHSVRVARNGAEALCLLAHAPRPALILLDVQMPVMDGLTFIEQLEQRPDRDDFEVVVMSAGHEQLARVQSIVRTLRKPLELRELLALIAGFIRRRGGRAGSATALDWECARSVVGTAPPAAASEP